MDSPLSATQPRKSESAPAPRETLTITDNRTGKSYEIPITHDTIRAADLRQIKVDPKDFGMMSYDPAFNNTASCISKVTYIDGDAGILRYRGYPIEDLAEKSTYLETAYLLLHGELPTSSQLKDWTYNVTHHTFIHESIKKFLDGFHYDAHPMGMMISTIAALSTFYHDAKDIFSVESRKKQTYRLVGKVPTIAAFSYRHTLGMPFVYPDNELSYPGNFLNMLFRTTEPKYRPNPTLERALDVLFILHADHEQNCSANTIRGVGSSHVDPYSATAAAIAALYGPLHGGANEEVLHQRGFLSRLYLSIDGLPNDYVPGAVRDSADFRGDRARGRDVAGPRAKNCAAPADLPWTRHPPLRSDRSAQLGNAVSVSHTFFRDALDNPIPRGIVNF